MPKKGQKKIEPQNIKKQFCFSETQWKKFVANKQAPGCRTYTDFVILKTVGEATGSAGFNTEQKSQADKLHELRSFKAQVERLAMLQAGDPEFTALVKELRQFVRDRLTPVAISMAMELINQNKALSNGHKRRGKRKS